MRHMQIRFMRVGVVLLSALALVAGPWSGPASADVTVTYSAPATSFNPIPDGYQDTFGFSLVFGPEATKADVTISRAGAPVRSYLGIVPPAPGAGVPLSWDGKTASGQLAPAGTYSVDVVVYDAGNMAIPHPGVGSFALVIETVTASFRATISAKASLVDDLSGRCGKLARPSSHRWAGSIGYYSNAKCKGKTLAKSAADGVHGVVLGKVINGHQVTGYPSIKVSAYGAAAKGYAGDRARLTYLLNDGHWAGRGSVLPAKAGWHSGSATTGSQVVWADDNSVVWDVYTVKGARYDVKAFAIDVTYQYQR